MIIKRIRSHIPFPNIVLRSDIEATVRENTRIRYMPNWNVFSILLTGLIKEARIPSVVIESTVTAILYCFY